MSAKKFFIRWFLLLSVLVAMGMLRAERSVAEMRGLPSQPSRLLRLVPQPDGDWTVTLMGSDHRVPVRRLLSMLRSQVERIGTALP